MSAVSFTVYAAPEPRGSKVTGLRKDGSRYVRDDNPDSYSWMEHVKTAAMIAMRGRPLFTGPLRIDMDFYLARPKSHYGTGKNAGKLLPSASARPAVKPDIGKLARGAMDAMEKLVFLNDSQQVEGEPRKFYGSPPRCEITVSVVEERSGDG